MHIDGDKIKVYIEDDRLSSTVRIYIIDGDKFYLIDKYTSMNHPGRGTPPMAAISLVGDVEFIEVC